MPQVECLLARVGSLCTNECNEYHPLLSSLWGQLFLFSKCAVIWKYFCSHQQFVLQHKSLCFPKCLT